MKFAVTKHIYVGVEANNEAEAVAKLQEWQDRVAQVDPNGQLAVVFDFSPFNIEDVG